MVSLSPLTLTGQRAQLEPLTLAHAPELHQAAQAKEIWAYYPNKLSSLDDVEQAIQMALQGQEVGTELPFTIRDLETGLIVGSTRLCDYSAYNRSVEIGWTWLNPSVWRTRINTESKFLLLRHCFEKLDLIRVFFKTDARNQRSQRAIERLGAAHEGVLRQHRILSDGFVRDSVYYSIIDSEWPAVKSRLSGFLN